LIIMPFSVKSELSPEALKEVALVMIRGLAMSSLSKPGYKNIATSRAFGQEVAKLWSKGETIRSRALSPGGKGWKP
jgi:hypothetical protein